MKILIYLILLLQFSVHGQTKEIVSKFQHRSLPFCISYSEIDSDSLNQVKTFSEADSLLLSKALVTKFLTPNKFKFGKQLQENDSSKYYAGKLISKKKKFIILTYKKVFGEVYESVASYVCTIGQKGKCISTILIASSIYSGTGSLEDGGRFPYYEEIESCIQKNLTIIVTPTNGNEIRYCIKQSGEIVKIK